MRIKPLLDRQLDMDRAVKELCRTKYHDIIKAAEDACEEAVKDGDRSALVYTDDDEAVRFLELAYEQQNYRVDVLSVGGESGRWCLRIQW